MDCPARIQGGTIHLGEDRPACVRGCDLRWRRVRQIGVHRAVLPGFWCCLVAIGSPRLRGASAEPPHPEVLIVVNGRARLGAIGSYYARNATPVANS